MSIRILNGDCRDVLKTLPDASVHCCVTSPPYFGLRNYGMNDQIGLEDSPQAYVEELVAVFREVRRVLRDDGTLWLNLGDSYAGSGRGVTPARQTEAQEGAATRRRGVTSDRQRVHAVGRRNAAPSAGFHESGVQAGVVGRQWTAPPAGFKNKDLMGIPWRVAFALQADGWYLRQDIIWAKPNPMPESVQDRCTKAHEYVFLLSKSPSYHYNADAIAQPVTASTILRMRQNIDRQKGSDRAVGKVNGRMKAVGQTAVDPSDLDAVRAGTRNRRSVWTIATQHFSEAHFATMAPELASTCIRAGCPPQGSVLDPFGGAGTTGLMADRLGCDAVLIELNPAYVEIARRRIASETPLLTEVLA